MTTDVTPTESMIGFDAEGVPPRHTSPASRQHTDQHEDTTRIIAPGKLLPPVPAVLPDDYGSVGATTVTTPLAGGAHGYGSGVRVAVSQADIFRSSGYRSPTVSPRDLDELDKQLEPLRTHRCRGCACALRPEQPCGSYCQRCNEELTSLESDCTSAWWSLPAWVLIAALAALGLAEVVVGVAWWWGKQ